MIRYIVFSHEPEYSVRMHKSQSAEFLQAITSQGLQAVESELDIGDVYVHGTVRERPVMPTSLNGLTLQNVRPASQIHINSDVYECPEGGDVELEFNQPGVYRIKIVRWPYKDKEFEIENQTP